MKVNEAMMKSVSIVGCGWFGLPLAKALVKAGFDVRGSKRSKAQAMLLAQERISGFCLDLDDSETPCVELAESVKSQLDSDYLVVNVPPGFRHDPDAYLRRLTQLKVWVSDCHYQRIIFISSTGVYPSQNQIVTESDAKMHSLASEHLLKAEQVFTDLAQTCVLRFAGLVGPKRHPGRFLSGKQNIAGGESPVNLVHLTDCVRAVIHILSAEKVQPVYNLCALKHPTRARFYQVASMHLNLAEPIFNDVEVAGKTVDGRFITQDLGFEYQFSDPMSMLNDC
ncbi:SDR family oxidoreductase [uncultured Shewanella sp.]|uniref:SDR family oxidoreductase n=1 Tax=uncultured Shewanella sp. TaxID=173975 RepID=UPI0026270501|nr:SDR family oxidoreductase [uncultured Shewanella sp.]